MKRHAKLLTYQYLQTLPKIAEGSANKLWIIPSEVGEALKGIGGALGNFTEGAGDEEKPEGTTDTLM